jgi:putative inorganic carbon (hco3(-)) transporter
VATVAAQASETSLLRFSRWMLYATVAGMPLYVVRWHYGPLPTTLLETLIFVTVGLYVIARLREGKRRPVSTPYDIPILLLLLAGAVSVVVAKDHRAALGLYRAYFIEPVAIFYVAVDLLRNAQHLLRTVFAFAIGSSAFAVINLAVFVRALLAHAVNVGAAPNAFYGDANPVAMYLEPPVAFATALVLFGQGRRLRLMGAAWLAITGSALTVMFSKGSYAALAVLVIVVLLTAPRWRLPLFGALLVAIAAATQIPLLMQRLATIPPSLNGRQEIFGAALGMIRDHPLLGLGLGGFSYAFRGVTPEIYPHDMWLTFWVEVGLLGVVAFSVILFSLLWRGWRAWPSMQGVYRPLLWGVLGGLVLWTVHGLVDSPYWKNDMSVEFWTLAALQVATLRSLRDT